MRAILQGNILAQQALLYLSCRSCFGILEAAAIVGPVAGGSQRPAARSRHSRRRDNRRHAEAQDEAMDQFMDVSPPAQHPDHADALWSERGLPGALAGRSGVPSPPSQVPPFTSSVTTAVAVLSRSGHHRDAPRSSGALSPRPSATGHPEQSIGRREWPELGRRRALRLRLLLADVGAAEPPRWSD